MPAVTNFLVSSLPAYVEQFKDTLVANFALPGRDTRSRISFRNGVKKGAKLPFLNFGITLQDASSCGFNPLDEAVLAQAEVNVEALKHDGQLCPKSLLGTYAEYQVRHRAGDNGVPFEAELMEAMTREVKKVIEDLIWKGDKTNGTGNMALMDGFLVQLAADASVIPETIASGASAYAGIMQVYAAMPDEAIDRGGIIFAGSDIFRAFIQDLVNMNMYHYGGPAEANPDEFYLPGTNVRIVKTFGLTGTNNVVATFAENLVYATDVDSDDTYIDLWWSADDRLFKWEVSWASGVGYFFPDQIVLGTFAATPVAVPGVNAAIAGIAECVCSEGGE